jgi:hypothetical protein
MPMRAVGAATRLAHPKTVRTCVHEVLAFHDPASAGKHYGPSGGRGADWLFLSLASCALSLCMERTQWTEEGVCCGFSPLIGPLGCVCPGSAALGGMKRKATWGTGGRPRRQRRRRSLAGGTQRFGGRWLHGAPPSDDDVVSSQLTGRPVLWGSTTPDQWDTFGPVHAVSRTNMVMQMLSCIALRFTFNILHHTGKDILVRFSAASAPYSNDAAKAAGLLVPSSIQGLVGLGFQMGIGSSPWGGPDLSLRTVELWVQNPKLDWDLWAARPYSIYWEWDAM